MEHKEQELIVLIKDNTPINVIGQKQFVGYKIDGNIIEVYEKINEFSSSTKVEIHPSNHHVVSAVKRWASFL